MLTVLLLLLLQSASYLGIIYQLEFLKLRAKKKRKKKERRKEGNKPIEWMD